MINKIEKNYMYISMTFLLLAVYVILFPFISKGLEYISPEITQCQYKRITGKDCPLCGGTRYMRGLGQVFSDITIKKKKKLKRIIIFDIIIHLIIVILFFSYEISFVYNS